MPDQDRSELLYRIERAAEELTSAAQYMREERLDADHPLTDEDLTSIAGLSMRITDALADLVVAERKP